MVPIYVIDFEGNKKNGICELGVVKLERWQISEVKEEVDINNFDKNLEYFLSIRRDGIFCAHSAQTEDSLLRHYWASPGNVPSFTDNIKTTSWGPWIDTKTIYKKLFKNLSSYELSSLISSFNMNSTLLNLSKEYCNSERSKFHNALYDALSCAVLLQNLQKFFNEITIEKLIFLSKETSS